MAIAQLDDRQLPITNYPLPEIRLKYTFRTWNSTGTTGIDFSRHA